MLFFIMSTFCILIDQWSKIWMEQNLKPAMTVIPKILEFRIHYNRGAAWGILERHTLGLAIFSFLSSIALFVYYLRLPRHLIWERLAVVLIFSGAVGNMMDRIFRKQVIDFIHLLWIRFPIFNVADICIVCGALLMLFSGYVSGRAS